MKTVKLSLFLLCLLCLTGLQAQDCRNMMLTSGTYSEKANIKNVIRQEFGGNVSIADWKDLKEIPNINGWISCMHLQRGQSFMVTRNGLFIFQEKRHYNVQYFPNGKVPAGFMVHDNIDNKLFLGSWYGLKINILVIKKETGRNDVSGNNGRRNENPGNDARRNESSDFTEYRLTEKSFSEKQDLEQVVNREYQGKCIIADWNDLKSIPNIDRWINKMNLQRDVTFFVTKNGKLNFSPTRQFFVLYSPSGRLPAGFAAHERIDNKLFLGSWYGVRRPILVKDFHNR